jgi:hypothetical protein
MSLPRKLDVAKQKDFIEGYDKLLNFLGETRPCCSWTRSFGQKTHLTAFSCGLLMIITQEPAQSLAALDAPLSIEVTVPRK